MTTDPIADMLNRIRNALTAGKREVTIPLSKAKVGIAKVLRRAGYIQDFAASSDGPKGVLRIYLKFTPTGESVIRSLQRVSRPGRRVYRSADNIPSTMSGMGISILTTSKGFLTDHECRSQNVGGEVVAKIG